MENADGKTIDHICPGCGHPVAEGEIHPCPAVSTNDLTATVQLSDCAQDLQRARDVLKDIYDALADLADGRVSEVEAFARAGDCRKRIAEVLR